MILLSLVTPSTQRATSSPNCFADLVDGDAGVLDDVVQKTGLDADQSMFMSGQDVGDVQGMDHVGLAGGAHLALWHSTAKR